jgi:hypothetical protein
MRLRLIAALLVLVSAPLLAQTSTRTPDAAPPQARVQPTTPVKPPPATGRITGAVFCHDTHSPARGAMVMAQLIPKNGPPETGFGTQSARVSMDGTYTIDHLRPGDYTVVALFPGYLSIYDDLSFDQLLEQGADPSANPAIRAALTRNGIVSVRNDDTAHLDVTLERGASVSGRVLYSDGSPATQVAIDVEDVNAKPYVHKLNQPDINPGAFIRGLIMHQSQGTDDEGNYRIAGLKPGVYRVAAIQPGDNSNGGIEGSIFFNIAGNPNSLHVYSGDTFHKKSAKTYELHTGDDITGIDITIPVEAFHRVQGHLATLDGTPVSVATLTLTDTADDSFVLRTQPVRDGSFTFSTVPSGTYKLSATDAHSGTISEDFPDNIPIQAQMLKDAHTLTDASTNILVKDSDLTGVDLQLPDASPPAPSTPSTP